MRSVAAAKLLQIVVRLLESSVTTAVASDPARRTLWVCIGLLDNLVERVEERQEIRRHEVKYLRSLLTIAGEDLPAADPPSGATEPRADDLRRALVDKFRSIDWPGTSESATVPSEVKQWLRNSLPVLLAMNAAEISRLRPTRYREANRVTAGLQPKSEPSLTVDRED